MLYELDRDTSFLGTDYKVVDVLDNNLLLVVNKNDYQNENYPLQTFIIPNNTKHD